MAISTYNHPGMTVNDKVNSTRSACLLPSLSIGLNFDPNSPCVPKEKDLQKISIDQARVFSVFPNPTEPPRNFKRMDLQWVSTRQTTPGCTEAIHYDVDTQ